MSVICVIPARYNSSRFPGKLLANALGKTILQRTWESASLCSKINGLYIATDNEKIAEHAKKIGAEVLWTSSNPRDGTERIAEALQKYPCLQRAELILNLQGDAPGTPPQTLQAIIRMLEQNSDAVMATAASPMTNLDDLYAPQTVKCVCDKQGNALYFSRSPIPYCQSGIAQALVHIGIYCYRSAFLKILPSLPPTPLQLQENLEQLRVLEWGYRIKVALVAPNPPSVDTPEDLLELEEFLYRTPLDFANLDSARQSQINSEAFDRRSTAPNWEGKDEGRCSKASAGSNPQNLTERGICQKI